MDFSRPSPDPSLPYQEMYTKLFKAVTAALYMMQDNEFVKARAILIQTQQETEELYIEGCTQD